MIIKPRIRGFICTTAHPIGCRTLVEQAVARARAEVEIEDAPKRALVVGASTGYGLAMRINACFGAGCDSLGVFYEKPGEEKRCASAGWYNAAALRDAARRENLTALDINGDAFSDEIKDRAIDALLNDGRLGPVDLLVYSLAAPRRVHPETGAVHNSTLKPIGKSITERNLDASSGEIGEITLPPASEEEIADTVAVMGGEDWEMWVRRLRDAGALAPNCRTVAFTYIGDKLTWPIYNDATIGEAKRDLDATAARLRELLGADGEAHIGVLKAVVTQASSAIPLMPLYLSLLFKVMKEKGVHEGCLEQTAALLRQLCGAAPRLSDDQRRLRCDGCELDAEVQREVERRWTRVTTENLPDIGDFEGYKSEFLRLFGFGVDGVDYDADVDPRVEADGLLQ